VGQALLNLYPLPNLGTGVANNFLFNPVRSITGNKYDIKIDQSFSDRDVAFVRYSHSTDDLDEPSFLPAPAIGNGPGVPGPALQPLNQVVASETHVFGPSLSNEARAGWTRLNLRALNINYGEYVSSEVGVPGGNIPGDILTSGLSIFAISGFRDLGDNGFSPAIIVSDNIQLSDNVNLITGKHSLKFGADVQRRRYNAFQSDVLRGSMTFSGTYTQDPASRAGTGSGAADALLGRPISGNIRYLTGTRGFRRTELGFYVQDTWKATSRLTFTLGLRYESFVGWPWVEVFPRARCCELPTGSIIRRRNGTRRATSRQTRPSSLFLPSRMTSSISWGLVRRAAVSIVRPSVPCRARFAPWISMREHLTRSNGTLLFRRSCPGLFL
jgi:outer membrane receptor protein involved in Fe transport